MPAAARNDAVPARLGITAVIPCHNEERGIARAYAEIRRELDRYQDVELLFVDDGSSDGTLARIKELSLRDRRVRYLSFARNFGLEAAFSAGFKYATKPWVIQFDADLQSPPAEAHKLVARALQGYDVVFAVREGRQDPWHRRVASSLQQWVATRLLGIELPRGASSFRMVRASVAKKVVALDLGTPYFLATVPLIGARYATVRTAHQARQDGPSRFPMRRLVSHSLDLFVGFSVRPLVICYLLATAAVLAGGAALALVVSGHAGVGAMVATDLAAGVLVAAALGVLARYLIRLLRGGDRPAHFYIREANLPIEAADDLYEHERQAVDAPPLEAAPPGLAP